MVDLLKSPNFNFCQKYPVSVFIGALLLGFAWQIRGMGTSDPSVVAFLFLVYLSFCLGQRKKFTLPVFGLIAFSIVAMRTGWGTFVPQSGLPGVIPGYLPPKLDIAVPWWYGYFWLFIVGISWFGIPALLFGGYLFTNQGYNRNNLLWMGVLFVGARYVAGFLAAWLIPYIAPEYFREIYLTGISARSYGSMRGNLSTALAIIPVLLYVRYIKKDQFFFQNSLLAMLSFAIALAVANVWRPISVLSDKITGMEGWGLWEFSSGFFFGLLAFLFYATFSEEKLAATDIPPEIRFFERKPLWRFLLNAMGLYFFLFYGVAEGLEGSIRKTVHALGHNYTPDHLTLKIVLGLVGIVLYWFYFHEKIGRSFSMKSFREKSLILLLIMLPFHYFNFAANRMVSGDIFIPKWKNVVVWLDSLTFLVVEGYLINWYRQIKES